MGQKTRKTVFYNSIFLFLICFVGLFTSLTFADLSGSLDEKAIAERIKPFGEVTIKGGTTQAETVKPNTIADIGQARYEETCKMCHNSGLAGAPKLGDKADWNSRLKEGMETLIKHAITGYKAMPAKGGCSTCSDEEIKKAVEFMTSKVK